MRLPTAVARWAGAVMLVLLATAGCTRSRDALVIYSGRGQNLIGPLLEQFSRKTNIPIDVRYDASPTLGVLIATEGRRTPADVFLSQSPGPLGFLADKGMFVKLDLALLDTVDRKFRSRSGLWVGLSGRRRVLVYNKEMVAPSDLPASVLELTAARYRGKVAVAPANASFEDFVSAMRELEGDDATLEWLTAMDRNDARTYANNNAIVAAVGRGEIPMGLVNHYYNHRFLEEDPGLPSRNYSFEGADVGSLVIVAGVGVLEASENKQRAMRFVEFLLSEDAQRYFTDETFEYPLAAEIPPRAGLPPLSPMEHPDIDLDKLGRDFKRTIELIERSGLSR